MPNHFEVGDTVRLIANRVYGHWANVDRPLRIIGVREYDNTYCTWDPIGAEERLGHAGHEASSSHRDRYGHWWIPAEYLVLAKSSKEGRPWPPLKNDPKYRGTKLQVLANV